MKVVNNQDQVAKEIEDKFGQWGVKAVGDDGNVCVSGNPHPRVRKTVEEKYEDLETGDGVQEGDVYFNWEKF